MKKIQLTPDEVRKMADLEGEFYMTVGKDYVDIFRSASIFAAIYCTLSVVLSILLNTDMNIAINNVMLVPLAFLYGYWVAK